MSLDRLVVGGVEHPSEVGDDDIASFVDGYVTFDDSPYQVAIQFTDSFAALDAQQQVAIILGAVEAMARLGYREEPYADVDFLFRRTAFETSHYASLRTLEQNGVVERIEGGAYRLRDMEAAQALFS